MTVRAHCMVTTYDPVTNTVLTSATVNVYNPGTVTPISPTIYDKLGNPLSNPLTSDATTGLCDFYLTVAQEVDLVVSKGGFTTRTYSNVPVLDDSSLELTALLTTTGDMVYASSANTPVRLAVGTNNYVMNVTGGVPKWTSALQVSDANGTVAIGTAATTSSALLLSGSLTTSGVQQIGANFQNTASSAATTEAAGVWAQVSTAATSFTCTSAESLRAAAVVKGAGSTITSAVGIQVDAQTVGGTNNYGILVSAPSGGAGENYAIKTPHIVLSSTVPTVGAGQAGFGYGVTALGGGSTPSFGTIGGSGPTTAAQNGWFKVNLGGTSAFFPYWV